MGVKFLPGEARAYRAREEYDRPAPEVLMRIVTVAAATLTLVLAVAVPALAAGGGPAPGSLIITPEQVDTSAAGFEKELKSKAVKSLEKNGDQWTIYFVAF